MQETLLETTAKVSNDCKNATAESLGQQISDSKDGNLSEYRVLARKYRPQLFSELIGQDVVVQTFKNAIVENRVHHAFVLTGTRGIGKTTTARIIAKALNCSNLQDGYEPCGKCESCIAIARDQYQDVLEIDAASNTSVDNVREIIDNTMFRPISGKYKIFIIDEVHMLSKSAFNALLKTLEEPPAHTKFIFATTEVRKIPITILSRCQRFDLRRVSIDELFKHFKDVCQKESVQADDESLQMIAASAKGSVRDGLSMLDQAISLSSGNITKQIAQEMLGNVDAELVTQLMRNIIDGKLDLSLQTVEKLYKFGSDPSMILEDLSKLLYNITRYKILKSKTLAISEGEMQFCKEVSGQLNLVFLTRAWSVMQDGLKELADSMFRLESLEIVIVKLHIFSTEKSPEDILNYSANANHNSTPQTTNQTTSQSPQDIKKN